MSANLSARFSLIDEMSSRLEAIADSGQHVIDRFEQAGSSIGASLSGVEESATQTATAIDGVAHSADELEEQYDICDRAAQSLYNSTKATADIQTELSDAMEEAASVAEELANSSDVSARTQEAFAEAMQEAEAAMREVQAAEADAKAAMEEYDAVILSGTENLNELEAAAERAGLAAERLAEANGRASEATEELGQASQQATEELENAGESGVDAFAAISSTLAAAGITATVKEIAEAAYEMAEAFSDAESTVVNATGATGEALDGLMQSTMKAYAAAKNADLSSTSAAIGEINTRMGLTGDALEDVTGKFLDYASITGTDVVGSVQNVTKVMNQWGVEGENVESVLDKLAYAGQVSGASVDNLSQTLITGAASFQNAGLSLDNTIQMLADFELAGINSTTAITAMRTAVNNFTKEGLDASTALQDTIQKIATMGNTSEATALAVETFGSRAGQQLALAIQNGTISVDTFNTTLDDTAGTLSRTAEASQTLAQKWQQANNSIQAAFTNALQPTIDGISSGFAEMTKGVGDFLNEHPVLTKALTAIGIGMGALVVGITGFVFITKAAIPAITTFGTALNTALGPIGWVAMAIGAVVTAVTAFNALMSDTDDAMYDMTSTTRDQYEELDRLSGEYDEAVAKYGETSEEASRLKYEMDDLSESIEKNGKTIEQLAEECDKVVQKHRSMIDSMNETRDSIHNEELGTMALLTKLTDLAAASDGSFQSQQAMKAVYDELGDSVKDLGISYEDLVNNQNDSVQALKDYAKALAEQQMAEAKLNEYVQLIQMQAEETKKLAEVEAEKESAMKRAAEAQEEYSEAIIRTGDGIGSISLLWSDEKKELDSSRDALETATESYDELSASLEETNARIAEIEGEWDEAAAAAQESGEVAITAEEAVALGAQEVNDKIMELAQAYEDAYNAAVSSFEGQFGLFDKAEADADATVAKAQEALNSQLEYWTSYNDNLETIKGKSAEDLNLTQENYEKLVSYVASGSEEAAGLAASMAEAIESGNEEAVTTLGETIGLISEKQDEAASAVAQMQTDLDAKMAEIDTELTTAVQGFDKSAEAATAATATINAYAAAISTGGAQAVAAAQAVADQVSAILNAASTGINSARTSVTVAGKARGTTDAPGVFIAGEKGHELIARASAYAGGTTDSDPFYIAGENGPELIIGEQGSTVFPTQETDRILSAINDKSLQTSEAIAPASAGGAERTTEGTESSKHITIDIAGGGSIEVKGGAADRESLLDMMQENMRPILENIIRADIFAEGDLAYDY